MKGKRFTEEKIISILKEYEANVKVPILVHKQNVTAKKVVRPTRLTARLARSGQIP